MLKTTSAIEIPMGVLATSSGNAQTAEPPAAHAAVAAPTNELTQVIVTGVRGAPWPGPKELETAYGQDPYEQLQFGYTDNDQIGNVELLS